MYVCICFGVTDSQVNAQIDGGARSMREIAASCRAGTDCGRCVKTICSMIPRDESRSCGGCTPRCGRVCRAEQLGDQHGHADADAADRTRVSVPVPVVPVPLAIVATDTAA